MIVCRSALAALMILCSAAVSGPLEDLGVYSNVVISQLSGDCYGVSVELRLAGESHGKRRISGAYYEECRKLRDAAMPVAGEFDVASGRLTLRAVNAETGVAVAQLNALLYGEASKVTSRSRATRGYATCRSMCG